MYKRILFHFNHLATLLSSSQPTKDYRSNLFCFNRNFILQILLFLDINQTLSLQLIKLDCFFFFVRKSTNMHLTKTQESSFQYPMTANGNNVMIKKKKMTQVKKKTSFK